MSKSSNLAWKPSGTPFLWQPRGALSRIREQLDGAGAATSGIAVYVALTEVASDKRLAEFSTTHAWLASLSGLSVRTVQDRLKDLERIGLVQITAPPPNAIRCPSTYRLVSLGNDCVTSGNHCRTFGNGEGGSVADIRRCKEENTLVEEDVEALVSYWNSKGALPKIQKITESRKKKLRARLSDKFFSENFAAAVDRVCQSDFCLGKGNRGWKMDIDFFLRPDSVVKILEGKYDNRAGQVGQRRPTATELLQNVSDPDEAGPRNLLPNGRRNYLASVTPTLKSYSLGGEDLK